MTRQRLLERSGTIPAAVSAIVILLLLAGLAVIFQNETSYREQKLRQADMQARILKLEAKPLGSTPDEMRKIIQQSLDTWGPVVQAAKITVD